MTYRFINFKNTRSKSLTTKHVFRFALFMAFGVWLLYQIKQSYTNTSINNESFAIHLNNERIYNMFGRKGQVKLSKSAHRVDSNMVRDDVTNLGEINEEGFGLEEKKKEHDMKERKSISTKVLTKMKSNNHDLNDSKDDAYRYLDENGIPELDRERLLGTSQLNRVMKPMSEFKSVNTYKTMSKDA